MSVLRLNVHRTKNSWPLNLLVIYLFKGVPPPPSEHSRRRKKWSGGGKKSGDENTHLRGSIQDRIGETMYFGNRVSSIVKRRGDLEKELIQLDRESIREEQALWKDISLLEKELRYKLEQYRMEKAKGDFF